MSLVLCACTLCKRGVCNVDFFIGCESFFNHRAITILTDDLCEGIRGSSICICFRDEASLCSVDCQEWNTNINRLCYFLVIGICFFDFHCGVFGGDVLEGAALQGECACLG